MLSADTMTAPSASDYWCDAAKRRFVCQYGLGVVKTRDIPDARRLLELEIAAVALVRSSVGTRYNALAPVNRLPPEVLILIFHFLREAGRISHSWTHIEWILATHVCRRWRSVALDHPSLWSHIQLDARWTEEFLRRSRRAPIAINYRLPEMQEGTDQLKWTILDHLSHIQDLSLAGELTTSIFPLLHGPAPMLEKLVLIGSSTSSDVAPLDSFNHTAPRLRHLSVRGWTIPWTSLAFGNLAHLEVSSPRYDDDSTGGTFGQMLEALGRMPLLEQLTIEHAMPPLPRAVTPHSMCGPRVTLPKLRALALQGDIRSCSLALNHIITPATTRHRVHCIFTECSEGLHFLLPWLDSVKPLISCIRTLSITESDNNAVSFAGWDYCNLGGANYELDFDGDDTLLIDFYFSRALVHGTMEVPPPLETLCKALSSGCPEVLNVMYDHSRSVNWSTMLAENKYLRYLELEFCESPYLAVLVRSTILFLAKQPHSSPGPIFPSLESLALMNVDFTHLNEEDCAMLSEWLKSWGPMKKLVMNDECAVTQTVLNELKIMGPWEVDLEAMVVSELEDI